MKKNPRTASFTLIELLVVIVIIGILLSFTIGAAIGVANKASRSRAQAEIQSISTALESYKSDNEIYPQSSGLLQSSYASSDGQGGPYQTASQILFECLSGQTNFLSTAAPATKVYLTFTPSQVNITTTTSWVQDPWGYAYGYSTGTPRATSATPTLIPYNGPGSFDLWSTGGSTVGTATFTNTWICNWK